MTGADVKRQVMEALTWYSGGIDTPDCSALIAALDGCVLLTAEEAATDSERETCQGCGCGYAIWSAPSDLWNLTVRDGDRAKAEDFSFLCPRCFMLLVEERVPQAGKLWIVRPERESDFDEFKPSGRFAHLTPVEEAS